MENENNNSTINNTKIVDRHTAYDALPDNIKDYSERVAYNSKLIYAELIRQKIFSEFGDVTKDNINKANTL